jgi:hypothetical protein
MNCHVMRALLALYPRPFRDRYGAELASVTDELIGAGDVTPLFAAVSLVWGAALEWGRLLFCSRRAVRTMAAAAIMAVVGSLYVTSQVWPQSPPASVHSASAPVSYWSIPGCVFLADPAGPVAFLPSVAGRIRAAAKPGQSWLVVVPQTLIVPGSSTDARPFSANPAHARPSPADRCLVAFNPFPARWIVHSPRD